MDKTEILSLDKTTVFEKVNVKKNIKLKIIITIISVIFILLISFPYIRDTFLINPKDVFNKSIDYVSNIVTSINYNSSYDINFKMNTNNPNLKEFNDYSFGLSSNIDKIFNTKLYMKDSFNNEYSYELFIKDKDLYHKFSNHENIIKYGSLDNGVNVKKIDVNYLVKKLSKTIKQNLSNENFSKKIVTKIINGKKVKLIKLTYNKNENDIKNIYDELHKDEQFKELFNNYNLDYKTIINNIDKEINIYVKDGMFSGLDLNNLHYYRGNGFELNYKNLIVKGELLNNKNEINIIKDKKLIGHLTVHEISKDKITLDYNIDDVKGMFNYNNNNIKLLIKSKYETTLDINIKKNKTKPILLNNTYTPLNEEEMIKIVDSFTESLKTIPIYQYLK